MSGGIGLHRGRGMGLEARTSARRAANSPWVKRLARVGLAARGLVYVIIGVLAVQIALGDHAQRADQKGAFQTLAQNGVGRLLLWLVVLGFLGYAAWQATDAGWGHYGETDSKKRTAKRVESGVKAVIYLALAFSAFGVATGSGGGGGGGALTAKLLQAPGGVAIVTVAGLVIIAVAAVLTWRGLHTKFEEHLALGRMSPTMRDASVRLGQVGYVARGVVLALVGVFVVQAALTADPGKAKGFDVALRQLAAQPYGMVLLLVVAVGLLCFGAYSFVESRYRRL